MKSTLKRHFSKRALAILLVAIFLVPTAGLTAVAQEPVQDQVGIVIPVEQGLARGVVGITPEQLDAMALDPQSWLLAEHMSYDAYTRNPVADWDGAFGGTAQDVDDATEFRAAIIILEFPDRPFYQGRPVGSGMTGNPGFGETAPNWNDPHDPARMEYLRNWVDSWLNVPDSPFVQADWSTTEGNRGLTMDGYWMETSLGAITMSADTFGPFMAPVLESQLDAFFSFTAHWHGQFWHASRDYFFGAGWTLRNWFPAYSVALGAPDVTQLGPYTGGANVRGVAKRMAMESGVDFVDEHGNALYDVILIALAGYCQSPTWQEFGKMIFPSHYTIAEQTSVPHPNLPGEVFTDPVSGDPRTGMDFTGWGRLNNIRETITAPGFDIIRDWPTFYMSDVELNWRRHLSEGFNQGSFLLARAIAEEGLTNAFVDFQTRYPGSNFTEAQFRDRIFRPGFIRAYADRMERTDIACPDEVAVNAAVLAADTLTGSVAQVIPVSIAATATAAQAQTARTNAVNAAIGAVSGLATLREDVAEQGVRSNVNNATTSPVVVEHLGVQVNTFPYWSVPFARGMVGRSATFNVDVNAQDVDRVATAISIIDAAYPFSNTIDLGGNDAARAAAITAYIRSLPGFPAGMTVNVHGYISGTAVSLQAARAALAVTVESGFASGRTAMVRVAMPPVSPLAASLDMNLAPETYDFNEFVYGDINVDDYVMVHPGMIDAFAHTMMPAFVPLSIVESPERAAFMQTHGNSEWVRAQLLALVEDAMAFAENCEINPYFQAASTRYVPWTSWYGGVSFWSNASPGATMQGRWGHSVILPSAVQSESAGMAVYSHEVGHLILLPDQDNFPYQDANNNWTQRSIIGPWCTMARGSFTGPYGAHTRWQIPARHGAAVGTGLIARHRIAGGLTDLTVPRRENHWSENPGAIMDPWNQVVRDDPENSLDVLYVPYTTFRDGPPVLTEVFARNIPVNRGFQFGANDPRGQTGEILGHNAIIIQGAEFRNQTPHRQSAIDGGAAARWQGVLYQDGRRDLNGFRMIETARWNYSIGGTQSGNISEAMLGVPGAVGNQQGFSVEVVQRAGYDSFAPDHGVVINRIQHLNSRSALAARSMSAGGMSHPATFVIDANPGSSGLVSFWNADGSPWMFSDCNFMQMAASAFRAGVHNNPYMYRTEHPLLSTARWGEDIEAALDPKWLPDDDRPGVWGETTNEWVDVHNNFHFYILQRHNNAGSYGSFLSYDVAIRNTEAEAYVVGGGLALTTVGSPTSASPGNFSRQRLALEHTGDPTATDIIRITLEGLLADPVMRTTLGGYVYMAHTRDQNVVILNNLFALAPGETIEFDVFIRVPADHTDIVFDTTGRLDVRASSETNSGKYAYVSGTEVNLPFALSFNIFNNGNNNNASLANMGIIRMWPQINGVGANLSYANLTVTAEDPDGKDAMEFVNVNRIWNNQDYVSLIDVNKHAPWQYIDMVVEYRGQEFEVRLINNMFLSLRAFNNDTCDEVPSMAGNIRIWPQLGGVAAPIPMSATFTAVDPEGNDVMDLITRNRQWIENSGWQDNYLNFDVDKNAQWQYIYFTVGAFGQSVTVRLVNNLFVAEQPPVLSFNIFNNANSNNASLANMGVIRMWTQLDGVNALVPYSELDVTATLPNGQNAMEFVMINRVWNDQDNVNLIDVRKAPSWQYINFTATLFGTTVEVLLVNDLYVPVTDVFGVHYFNNGNDNNASLANAGIIRIWMQLNGVNTPVPYAELDVAATLPNGQDAMEFVRINRIWNDLDNVNMIDVTKVGADWQTMDLTLYLGNQTLVVPLINNRSEP